MSGSVPRLPWRLAAPVLLAACCLTCSAAALAADPSRITAKPLWDAYPLDTGRPTSTAEAPKQASAPAQSAQSGPVRVDHARDRGAPVAVLVLFYSAIAGLLLGVGALGVRQFRRARVTRTHTGASHG
jgi:hypothetical protein